MKIVHTFICLFFFAGSVYSQNKLPTCEGDNYEQWNSCTGTIKGDDGSAYEGDFANGQIDGYGLLTLPSGEKVLGQFKKNVISGRGLLVAKDGSRYAGEFDQNFFNGQGIFVLANGERKEGVFRNGQFLEAKKVTDAQILALLAAPPVLKSATILSGKVNSEQSVANESLQKLDVLLFANSEKCNSYPYRIVKDLNGKTVLNHIDKNRPINIFVGALTSKYFPVGDGKDVNRSKMLSEIVGREAGEEYKVVIQAKLKSIGLDEIYFINSDITWHCDVMNGYHIAAVLRMDLDEWHETMVSKGKIILIGEIPATEMFTPISEKIKNEFADVNRTLDLLQKDPNSIGAIVKYKQGQNYMKLKSTGPCIIKPKDAAEKDSKLGFRVSTKTKTRFNYNNEQNFALVVETVDALWQNIQIGKCDVSFATGEEFRSLRKALENTKDDAFRVELGQDKAETLLSLVQSYGYKDMDAYRFAISLTPILTPDDISKLAKYKVTSPDTFKSVVDRIRAVKYEKEDVNPSIKLIFQFLSDEDQASKTNGLTATVIKKERETKLEKEAQIEKERLAEAQRIRNQPLSKATLNSKLEYRYYYDGSCKEDTGQRCLNVNQYKQICDLSNGFTKKVRSLLGVYYNGDYSGFLSTGGTLANTKYGWNGKTCVISFNVTGTFKGTTHDKEFIGVIDSFIVTDSKEVLINGASF